MPIVRMSEIDLRNKRVLIREDLNVPIKDGKVTSEQRILAALPTLALALDQGAAVMVMSHLGRPTEGHFTEDDSLKPVAERLTHHLGREVRLVRDAHERHELHARRARADFVHERGAVFLEEPLHVR